MAEKRQQKQDRHPILITGAAGLIGCRLAESLLADYPVMGFDVAKQDQKLPNVDWIHCDLTDDDAVTEALARLRERHGERLASVVHLAAYYDFSGKVESVVRKLDCRRNTASVARPA